MSKFRSQLEKSAKSVDEAVSLAVNELNLTRDDVEIEVLEEGAKGFLGIGAKDAKVLVKVKDTNAVLAKGFLSDIFNAMKLDIEINAKTDSDTLSIDLVGDDMGIVIGKRGDTLDALQYLTSLIVNHENEEYVKVAMDTENYREKRHEALLALSQRLAEKVSKTGRKFTLEPMNPYERRIIHANLQNNSAVTTYSIGDEPYRKVVIAPKNPKPHYNKKPPYRKSGGYKPNYSSDTE